MTKKKMIHESGNRKRAVARATLKEGTGLCKVNNRSIENIHPEMSRLRMQEPIILAGDKAKKLDISVKVHGGGISSQADAARLAIGRALVQHDNKLKESFLEYDRQLLVADVRRKENVKPNHHGQARAKRQKSYR